jgi:hypothetical protein
MRLAPILVGILVVGLIGLTLLALRPRRVQAAPPPPSSGAIPVAKLRIEVPGLTCPT